MTETWIRYHEQPSFSKPIALVGSPGLRSIGIYVIDHLIHKISPTLMAELYSTHFPLIYQTRPIYAANPSRPGIGGILVRSTRADLPKVEFYYTLQPELIIIRGYHANFNGQYEVAEKVVETLKTHNIQQMIVIAGHGLEGNSVCCAATDPKILTSLQRKYNIETGYEGAFYGFSGVVFGIAKQYGIPSFCLFAKTEPVPEEPEQIDPQASKNVFKKLMEILSINISW